MSLDAQLTASRLRTLAGYAFARGDAYFRDGRVSHCEQAGDVIRGIVTGTSDYHVEVAVRAHGLFSHCTCPVGSGFCKHAVALALHWREHGARTVRASSGPAFATAREAREWAEEHHLTHLFEAPGDRVVAELHGQEARNFGYMFARLPFAQLASVESAGRFAGGFAAPIAAAARRVMEQECAIVAAGIAEEAVGRKAPSGGPRAELWARLIELRAEVRREAPPRSRAYRALCTLSCDPEEPSLTWIDRDRGFGAHRECVATLRGAARALEVTCRCGTERGCVHRVALIDAALDLLADPAREPEATAIATELVRPGWSRALAALAEREAEVVPARGPIEVWWELSSEVGETMLVAIVKKQLKRGGWSAGTRMNGVRLLAQHGDVLDARDRGIAEQAAGWVPTYGGTYPVRAFAALVGHTRVLWDRSDTSLNVTRGQLGFVGVPAGSGIRLVPALDGNVLDPRLVAALLNTFARGEPLVYFDLDREDPRVVLIDVADDARHLAQVLGRHGDEFPPESHGSLFERLAALEAKLPVVVPDSLKGTELAGDETVVVRVRLVREATLELEAFVRPAAGAPLFQPGVGPRDVLVVREGERGYVRRRLDEELPLVRGLLARLPMERAEEGPPLCFQLQDDDALALVLALEAPPPGLSAEWVEAPPTFARAVVPAALRVTLDTKRDWFAIAGDIKIGSERLELAVLLDAARRQRRFVKVGANRWAELSAVLRERLGAVADQTYDAKGRLEISPAAVPAMRALGDAGAEIVVPPRWQLLADRLAAAEQLVPRPPKDLCATLRDYQMEGHAWLSRLAAWGAGACLADDMGLGKTVQAIAVLLDRAALGPALVIAPTSVVFNWEAELARFAPELRVIRYGEATDRAASLARLGKRDVVIASYGLLARDSDRLAQKKFATLVVDEAQQLKNASTKRAKAARSLDAEFRVALSGTPFENHLGELWSLFSVVFPGLLGSWDQFRDRYAVPIERNRSETARMALSRVLRPFVLRRTKAEVASELPARTEIEMQIELDAGHRALYEDARLAAVAELTNAGKDVRDEQQRFQVLAALTRLRLLACHPRLYDATSTLPSAKLERLLELLEELRGEGHRALVFSQFTSHLGLVRTALDGAGYKQLYLDGETPAARRGELVREFQAGGADVFLISLKAGGTGLNLTAADYVIHLDPWWNPAVEDQATDRAHRIGQTRPVTVYRLIARATIEERILTLHGDKRALVASVLDGTGVAGKLSTKDMLALLTPDDPR
jgi:superfamily II DNA or RNA helicase